MLFRQAQSDSPWGPGRVCQATERQAKHFTPGGASTVGCKSEGPSVELRRCVMRLLHSHVSYAQWDDGMPSRAASATRPGALLMDHHVSHCFF